MKFLELFSPSDKKFFPLFEKAADNLVEASRLLLELLTTESIEKREEMIKAIKDLENKGDEITHTIYNELNKSFITPFDREDIHELTSAMDDVLDCIDGSSKKIKIYNLKTFPKQFTRFGELIVDASSEIKLAIYALRHFKDRNLITKSCIKINDIENEADEYFEIATMELFEWETDAIELIKKRAILSELEKATDKAEDVSDVLKGIIVKTA